jgi:peptidoglycan/xylan/chitin deacetylase (PgdA/CDA1 family)
VGQAETTANGLDSQLVSASPAAFDRQMDYIRRHFEVVSLDDWVGRVRTGQSLPQNAALVTFDDGYRDNYDLAYPVLRRHALPATIFLTTSFVDSTQQLWWDELATLIKTTKAKHVCIPGLEEIRLETRRDRRQAMERLRHRLKAIPDDERRNLLGALTQELGDGGQPALAERVCLSWDEVRTMSRNGVTFGAHTHTHPILTRVPPERAREEIATSRRIVEREVGRPARSFAYPNGLPGDFDARTREMLIEEGFQAAVTLVHGTNVWTNDHTDLLALRRIHMTGDDHMVFIAKVSGALEALAARFPHLAAHAHRH